MNDEERKNRNSVSDKNQGNLYLPIYFASSYWTYMEQAALDEHRARMRGEEGGSVAFICAQRWNFFTRNVDRNTSWFFKVYFSGFCSPTSGTDLVLDQWKVLFIFFLKDFHFHILTWQLLYMIVMIVSIIKCFMKASFEAAPLISKWLFLRIVLWSSSSFWANFQLLPLPGPANTGETAHGICEIDL